MTIRYVLGIDPGSSKMGVAVWEIRDGREPVLAACFPLCAPSHGDYRYAPDRLIWLRTALTERTAALGLTADGGSGSDVAVAWEHLTGHEVPQAPALEACIVMLRQWAEGRGWPWAAYAPAVWRQVVALLGSPATTKVEVRDRMELRVPELRQLRSVRGGMDAVESAAIGLWHAEHLRVGAVVGHRERRRA